MDSSVDCSKMSREDVLKALQQYGKNLSDKTSTVLLKQALETCLLKQHFIHDFVKTLSKEDLKDQIWKKEKFKGYYQDGESSKTQIARFYLKNHPKSPLTSLKLH